VLAKVFFLESSAIPFVNFPFGVSIVCVLRKVQHPG
jgi:hypothetical protein